MGLRNKIESLIRKIRWRQWGDYRKIHWINWKDMCKPKFDGGMGFKDLALFNETLLAKQVWRLLHNQKSIFYRDFKTRFFPNYFILEAKDSNSRSYACKNILKRKDVLRCVFFGGVGSGALVKIWQDNWLPILNQPKVLCPIFNDYDDTLVSSLINPKSTQWHAELIDSIFSP